MLIEATAQPYQASCDYLLQENTRAATRKALKQIEGQNREGREQPQQPQAKKPQNDKLREKSKRKPRHNENGADSSCKLD
uniref:Uncharacterized protein n=1 Tax=Sphaerodactylus townsendi TaxID=933632 RepID=A0ACB8ERN6_9SAUR